MMSSAARDEVLVGVDPREVSVPVLAWAAAEAARRGVPLRLLLSVPPLHETRHVDTSPHYMSLRAEGEKALATAADTVRALRPDLPVTTQLLDGMPAAVLCRQAAAHARLVVVGSRRLSRPEEILSAGSVIVPLSAQADCPVVVVGEPEHTEHRPGRLVVGVDGSESSRAAVEFAFEEASMRDAAVRAVSVWQRPLIAFGDDQAVLDERRRLLGEALSDWTRKYPDVPVTQEVLRGHPVERLAQASADALAVVVGRRGRGGYTGMRLGSVVHGLLHRAHCPVITVPVVTT
ncbi:universal stress protein [Streptomyces apocyni]|uniref:universal stress protein n=1 Tax=Streptomyces apocyni TaxID=2654677 RepID=UPI0012EA1B6B|nr:universal stress protein [Streptomyces apocyni]